MTDRANNNIINKLKHIIRKIDPSFEDIYFLKNHLIYAFYEDFDFIKQIIDYSINEFSCIIFTDYLYQSHYCILKLIYDNIQDHQHRNEILDYIKFKIIHNKLCDTILSILKRSKSYNSDQKYKDYIDEFDNELRQPNIKSAIE